MPKLTRASMSSNSLRTVDFYIDGEPGAAITVTEVAGGKLKFDIHVHDDTSRSGDVRDVGDLRGIFLDINPDQQGQFAWFTASAPIVTNFQFNPDKVKNLKNGDNINGDVLKETGPFDIGIAFGRPGQHRD